MPGTWIPIVSPDDPVIDSLSLILVANRIYASEIRESLRQRAFSGKIALLKKDRSSKVELIDGS
jgi:hypothetical protein